MLNLWDNNTVVFGVRQTANVFAPFCNHGVDYYQTNRSGQWGDNWISIVFPDMTYNFICLILFFVLFSHEVVCRENKIFFLQIFIRVLFFLSMSVSVNWLFQYTCIFEYILFGHSTFILSWSHCRRWIYKITLTPARVRTPVASS